MIPATRIRLTRAPKGFERLQGKEGKILRLLPIPQNPLVYCASFDEEYVDLNVSPVDVEVLIHHEASNGDGDEMLIEINGLSFCKAHRLETCGTCGLDVRFGNLVKELGDFEGVVEAAEELDRALDDMNAPQRHAPGSKAYRPVVTPAIEMLPANLDPSILPAYPLEIQDSTDESVNVYEDKAREAMTLPLQRVREKIVALCKQALELYRQGADQETTISIALRDEAKSEVLRLEIVDPIRSISLPDPNADPAPVPLLVIRWFHMRASNQAAAVLPEATVDIACRLDEMALLAEILKVNATKLEPSFVFQTKASAPFALSALANIPVKCETNYYAQLGDYCHRCGTSGTKMFRCSRCKAVKFCSRVCQKKNWKHHKNECIPVTS